MSVKLCSLEDGIFTIKVSRPAVRNALDWEAMDAFEKAVEEAYMKTDMNALIVTGSGDAFIAGGDLKALHGASTQADGWRLSRLMTRALVRLERLPCPVIAAINGPARGGGAEIALACDLRVVAQNADMGFVQITLGLIPGWGGGQRLLRLVGYSRALEWLVTGRILSPQEMLTHGLANRVTPAGEALPDALDLARSFREYSPEAVRATKRLLRVGMTMPPAMASAHEQAEFPSLWASEAHQQAVDRWFEQRGVGNE